MGGNAEAKSKKMAAASPEEPPFKAMASSMPAKLASAERPPMKPHCNGSARGSTKGEISSLAALQMKRFSAFVALRRRTFSGS